MANQLTRFEPFNVMEDFLRDFHLRPSLREWNVEPRIKMDVEEDDKAYIVKAEIPGVKKEDISVDVEGNVVSITAELKQETEQKTGKTLRSERYYGAQSRTFTVSHDIDSTKVEAKYADGVLSLTLPKLAGKASKHIAIH